MNLLPPNFDSNNGGNHLQNSPIMLKSESNQRESYLSFCKMNEGICVNEIPSLL